MLFRSEKKPERREFLFTASYAVGAVGVGAVVWPLVDQMNPDASVKALASTEVDVSSVQPGKTITVLWRGKPVFLKRRATDEIAEARAVSMDDLPDPQKDEERVKEIIGTELRPTSLLCVGYPIKKRPPKQRRQLKELIHVVKKSD